MKATENFFARKRAWSQLKDGILACYLTPYIAKLLMTRRKIIIADCFAGKGRFDDGKDGSPRIIASAIADALERDPSVDIEGIFVEKKYFQDLVTNLRGYKQCTLLDETFENWIDNFLSTIRATDKNIFLYVDPYGIKSLDFAFFQQVAEKSFSTFELFINFNSFGFLREGCRLLGLRDFEVDEEDDEYERDEPNSIPRMNKIASGNYWLELLRDYHDRRKSMREVEKIFSDRYEEKLKTLFQYVVNIPIKKKRNHHPKYRMFFGTNHHDGLLLMADKMSRTWKDFVINDRSGQGALFEAFDYPDMAGLYDYDLREDILQFSEQKILLKDLLVHLVEKYGITFPEARLKKEVSTMEKDKILSVERDPATTPTGRLAISMDYKRYKIWVERSR